MSYEQGSTLGVAFVAASLALGICMGVDFKDASCGPDLLKLVKAAHPESIPEDVRAETLRGISEYERAKPGDWIAIWGGKCVLHLSCGLGRAGSQHWFPAGSATSANLTVQLARLAGLRVAIIVDSARHGLRLSNHKSIRPDLLVDSHDPQRAIEILKSNLGKDLRFGIDTAGKETAASLSKALTDNLKGQAGNTRPPTPPATPRTSPALSAHLIGLSGVPMQDSVEAVVMHSVPIKLFHELPAVGNALVTWLERLLAQGLISPPEIIDVEQGLANVNKGLDRMRRGDIRGGKLVVRLDCAE
jgi:hypothetical protein